MVHMSYSYRMYYYCDCLPFSHLDDCEFQSVLGCWSIDPSKLKTYLFDLITNPDKFDECDPDHILPLPSSDYYSVYEISSTCGKSRSNALTLLTLMSYLSTLRKQTMSEIKPENGGIWINTDVQGVYLTYFMILFMRYKLHKDHLSQGNNWPLGFDICLFVIF